MVALLGTQAIYDWRAKLFQEETVNSSKLGAEQELHHIN